MQRIMVSVILVMRYFLINGTLFKMYKYQNFLSVNFISFSSNQKTVNYFKFCPETRKTLIEARKDYNRSVLSNSPIS